MYVNHPKLSKIYILNKLLVDFLIFYPFCDGVIHLFNTKNHIQSKNA